MDIRENDIEKLALLSRLSLSKEEMASLSRDLPSILDYVSEIKKVSSLLEQEEESHKNQFREDTASSLDVDREALLSLFSKKEGDYLKVQKIIDPKG